MYREILTILANQMHLCQFGDKMTVNANSEYIYIYIVLIRNNPTIKPINRNT